MSDTKKRSRDPHQPTAFSVVENSNRIASSLLLSQFSRLSYLMLFGIAIIFILITFILQPRTIDDLENLVTIRNQNLGLYDYVIDNYFQFTGRIFQILLVWITASDTARLIFQLLSFILLGGLVFLATAIPLRRWPNLKSDKIALMLVGGGIWFGYNPIGVAVVWTTGATSYFYPIVLMLLFVLPYFQVLCSNSIRHYTSVQKFAVSGALGLLGLALGTSQEQVVFMAGLLSAVWLYGVFVQKKLDQIPIFLWVGLIGLLVGGLILLSAPGNYARLTSSELNLSLSQELLYAGAYLFKQIITPELLIWLLVMVIVSRLFSHPPGSNGFRLMKFTGWTFIGVGLLGSAPVLLTMVTLSAGTAFPCVVCIVIGTACLVNLPQSNQKAEALQNLLLVLVALALFSDSLKAIYSAVQISRAEHNRDTSIQEQIEMGRRDIVVPRLPKSYSRLVYVVDELIRNPTIVAQLYSVDTIRLSDNEIADKGFLPPFHTLHKLPNE